MTFRYVDDEQVILARDVAQEEIQVPKVRAQRKMRGPVVLEGFDLCAPST